MHSPRAVRVALRWGALTIALTLGGVCAASLASAAGPETPRPGGPTVLVTRLEGPVSPVMAEVLHHAIARAVRDHHAALVLELDTPGGLETSMRAMVKDLLASEVPVIAWVAPSGARAASAGVFIVMAADVALMAPGTNIGAATPINLQGPMDSTLARKATNDAAAFARTIALQRGRNAAWAERAVREAVAVDEREAVRLAVVDTLAATLDEVFARANGTRWARGDRVRVLELSDARVVRFDPGFRHRLLALLVEPNVAYLLMMIGFYGILFELQNPGAILPGIVGGISLILAFLALSVLPVNLAGVALIVLAMVFFLAELKVASHGLLGAGGILALVLGSLILFDGGPVFRVAWPVIGGATLVTLTFFGVVIGAGLRAQRGRVTTGAPGMIGRRGVALEELTPQGRVRIGDEIWSAHAAAAVASGAPVEVVGIEGLVLRVRGVAQEG
ncbi:MAG: nodulation protein NfeD [Candidatus Eisenbacteria bacterium]|uniref:Nodulation protein NfeD n=1 Tax=Eiseniibacteriota bacterium TaxID=2212470 RepID=A0A849SIW5_UNCEI|nr:nodulation protein NfeD [Candidatus Eisenbacteria bacterium]